LETKINAGQEELREEISVFQERTKNIETGKAELEERVTRNLREVLSSDIEATIQDIEVSRRDLVARTRRAGGNSAGANADHIQTEAAHAFIDGMRDREVKQFLLLDGACKLNEALNQAMKLEAAKAAAWPTSRMREVTRVPTGRPPTPRERRRNERPVSWQCGTPGRFWRYCR
jgi:hypothetical protein